MALSSSAIALWTILSSNAGTPSECGGQSGQPDPHPHRALPTKTGASRFTALLHHVDRVALERAFRRQKETSEERQAIRTP